MKKLNKLEVILIWYTGKEKTLDKLDEFIAKEQVKLTYNKNELWNSKKKKT